MTQLRQGFAGQVRLIDSHCHLNFKAFEKDWKEVLESSLRSGVEMIIVGTDLETSKKAIEIASKYSGVWAAIGFHPTHVLNRDWRSEIIRIADLINHKKVVAVGEIGLDRYRLSSDEEAQALEIQERVFDFLVGEAQKAGKPIIIHNREAMNLLMDKLPKLSRQVKGVLHCYPGNLTQAKKLFEAGFKIGFTGLITYENKWDKLLTQIPLENILIETDAPYLTPFPHRGKRNIPENVRYVAEHISKLRGISLEQVTEITYTNTHKLFNLK